METEEKYLKTSVNKIVIGFTGSIGSGCTYIAKELSSRTGYKYIKLSTIIREYLKATGRETENIEDLQDAGNELRKQEGTGYLISKTFKSNEEDIKSSQGIIIDVIKNEAEVDALRVFPNFFLFSVHAEENIRSNRTTENGRFGSEEYFLRADEKDRLQQGNFGQQVKRCNDLADIIILNPDNFDINDTVKKTAFIDSIYGKYILPIKDYSGEEKASLLNWPSVDELCMTIAYSASKMSSCLQRKVGAVIARINEAKDTGSGNYYHLTMPVIVSTGYNEVPLGAHKCVSPNEQGMCFRVHLQQKTGINIKFCPSCGTKIDIQAECPKCKKVYTEFIKVCSRPDCKAEIELQYKCTNTECNADVFNEFLPGAKHSPGKLLDMCRALHAEEVAILNLIKSNVSSENLTLYTTTQPCNLCANKIVNAGIRRVVYSEPYSMKESEKILKDGDVKVDRFEGIKSHAFFKLY